MGDYAHLSAFFGLLSAICGVIAAGALGFTAFALFKLASLYGERRS